jgi:hypothetical protein
LLDQTIALGRLSMPAFALALNTPKDLDYAAWSEHLKIVFSDITIMHSRRKVLIPTRELFEQLPPEAKKFLRQ